MRTLARIGLSSLLVTAMGCVEEGVPGTQRLFSTEIDAGSNDSDGNVTSNPVPSSSAPASSVPVPTTTARSPRSAVTAPDQPPPTSPSLPLQGTVIHVGAFTQQAIQIAMGQASSGGTVFFPAGTYPVAGLVLKSGVLYHGEPGAILVSSGGGIASADSPCHDIAIDGLTFSGGNLAISGNTGVCNKITVVNSTFENIATEYMSGWSTCQAILLGSVTNSTFDHNYFTNLSCVGGNGIMAFNIGNVSISWNTFAHSYQGMHVEPKNSTVVAQNTLAGTGVVVSHNTATGFLRMGIEVQGNAQGMVISYNNFSAWRLGDTSMGISFVPSSGTANQVIDNQMSASSSCVNAIELSGHTGTVQNNTLTGFGTGISIADATGTQISGNTIAGFGQYGAFSPDGGFCPGEIFGANTINGQVITGHSTTGWPQATNCTAN